MRSKRSKVKFPEPTLSEIGFFFFMVRFHEETDGRFENETKFVRRYRDAKTGYQMIGEGIGKPVWVSSEGHVNYEVALPTKFPSTHRRLPCTDPR
jgi:hypothetical protein